jgi:hypothetical protein
MYSHSTHEVLSLSHMNKCPIILEELNLHSTYNNNEKKGGNCVLFIGRLDFLSFLSC